MAKEGVSGAGIAALAVGGLFLYSGIAGKSFSQSLLFFLRGKNPTGAASANPLTGAGAGSSTTADSMPPVAGAPANQNQAIARMLMPSYGWNDTTNWSALVALWDKESGWSNTADTRQTGAGGDGPGSAVFAYGIAQARPATKYPKAGQPPDLGGQADPKTQIVWGLQYIKGRYGSPQAAWNHELANNWY